MQQAELIITYLRGELRGPQLQEFEQDLLDKPELKATVKDYQTILQGLKSMGHEATLQEIKNWNLEEGAEAGDSQLVMDYLAGTMDAPARKRFEERLTAEPALLRAVKDQEAIVQGFRGMQHQAFAEEVAGWAADLPSESAAPEAKVIPMKKARQLWRYASAAAVLLLLVAAFWWLDPLGNQFSYTVFRQENFVAPMPLTDRGSMEAILEAATRDYAAKRYAEAVEKLKTIAPEDSLYIQARFWLGHTYYQLQEYANAVEAFTESLEPPGGTETYELRGFNQDNAAWTRILAQMARFDKEKNALLEQDLEYFLIAFLEKADRSDTYYAKGKQLQEALNE